MFSCEPESTRLAEQKLKALGTVLEIREDDLTGEEVRALLALHLAEARTNTPAEFSFALDLSGLQAPNIIVFTAWAGPSLAGVGALKTLGDGSGEVKSMRTAPAHLRQGVGGAILDRIIAEARRRGLTRLSLETGTVPSYVPALALYRHRGFVDGEAFGDYQPSAYNRFLHLDL
jgi:putative acetyltransferase